MFQPEPVITYFELNYIVVELISLDKDGMSMNQNDRIVEICK